MFLLAELKDSVTIEPHNFEPKVSKLTCISDSLNKKFANKVVNNVGLCIALWDIIKIEEAFIFPGDGSSHSVVHFRFVVFRPFMDEVLVGKVKSSSRDGVQVTVNFFDDIFIPGDSLQEPSRFDESEQLWVWSYVDEEGADPHDLFMDIGEEIRFRITDECFTDTSPTGPTTGVEEDNTASDRKCPYQLTACITEPGLGLLSWWRTAAEDDE